MRKTLVKELEFLLESGTGFEPANNSFADCDLNHSDTPTWIVYKILNNIYIISKQYFINLRRIRESNPFALLDTASTFQVGTLPFCQFSKNILKMFYAETAGFEPTVLVKEQLLSREPLSATQSCFQKYSLNNLTNIRANRRIRTDNHSLTRRALYHWSYIGKNH